MTETRLERQFVSPPNLRSLNKIFLTGFADEKKKEPNDNFKWRKDSSDSLKSAFKKPNETRLDSKKSEKTRKKRKKLENVSKC